MQTHPLTLRCRGREKSVTDRYGEKRQTNTKIVDGTSEALWLARAEVRASVPAPTTAHAPLELKFINSRAPEVKVHQPISNLVLHVMSFRKMPLFMCGVYIRYVLFQALLKVLFRCGLSC